MAPSLPNHGCEKRLIEPSQIAVKLFGGHTPSPKARVRWLVNGTAPETPETPSSASHQATAASQILAMTPERPQRPDVGLTRMSPRPCLHRLKAFSDLNYSLNTTSHCVSAANPTVIPPAVRRIITASKQARAFQKALAAHLGGKHQAKKNHVGKLKLKKVAPKTST